MKFGIIEVRAEANFSAKMQTLDWNYGFGPTNEADFISFVPTNCATIHQLILGWREAGHWYRRANKKNIFVVTTPEGTCTEYAPKQKLPPGWKEIA